MRKQEPHLREIVRELTHAISGAISGSSEVGSKLHRLQEEGYTLRVTLDFNRPPARVEEAAPAPLAATEPTFRIDSRDLFFLRSIGIDPTRRLRRRRR